MSRGGGGGGLGLGLGERGPCIARSYVYGGVPVG